MTIFDRREEGFEAKFAHDQEQEFKVKARRNRIVGLWAGEQMGYDDKKCTKYAENIFEGSIDSSDQKIIDRIFSDLENAGIDIKKEEIQKQLNVALEEAKIALQ